MNNKVYKRQLPLANHGVVMVKKKDWKVIEKELGGLPVSTTDEIPGMTIKSYKGYVWGTSVQSKFFGHDILAVLRALIGGEVWSYTQMINQAKHNVIQRLVSNARALGADAVVGVRMGSEVVSPGMIEIFAYGTAVKLKKKK